MFVQFMGHPCDSLTGDQSHQEPPAVEHDQTLWPCNPHAIESRDHYWVAQWTHACAAEGYRSLATRRRGGCRQLVDSVTIDPDWTETPRGLEWLRRSPAAK